MDTRDFADVDCCRLCGNCLSKCPVLHYSPERARTEKDSLNRCVDTPVLDRCTTCFSCNSYCPNGCHPYELILQRWHERYLKQGLPAIARMVIPGDESSIWRQLYPMLPADELEQINKWRKTDGKKGTDILLTGCFSAFSPYLAATPVLGALEVYGDERLWCSGGHIYQLGLLDVVEQAGLRAKRALENLSPGRVVTMMAAEHAMLTRILPEHFGIHVNAEVITLEQWLQEQLQTGSLKLHSAINRCVTIHDNCFSKSEGEPLWQAARSIVSACGAEIVEMPHRHGDSLCCGFGAAAGQFSLLDLIDHGARRLKEAEQTGASCLVVYCPACYFIFSLVKELYGSRLELYHIVEIVDMASGGRPLHRTRQRAFQIIAIISANITRMLFNRSARRLFFIDISQFDRELAPGRISPGSTSLVKFFNAIYSGLQNPVALNVLHSAVRLIIAVKRRFGRG